MPELAPQQQQPAAPPPAPFRIDPMQLLKEAVRVLTEPAAFYAGIAGQQGLQAAFVFAVAMGVVAGAVGAVLLLVFRFAVGQAILGLVLMPLAAAIGAAVGGAILYLVSLIAGGEGTYERSFRVAAYVAAVMPIAAPLYQLGWTFTTLLGLAAQVYGLYVAGLGVIALHAADRRKTFICMGVLAAVLVLLGLRRLF